MFVQCSGNCLNGLRCRKEAKYDGFCHLHKTETCGICLEELKINSDELLTLVDCGHKFCKKCIYPWILEDPGLHQTCPICRAVINIEDCLIAFRWGLYYNYVYRVNVSVFSKNCLTQEEQINAEQYLNIIESRVFDQEMFDTIQTLAKNQINFAPLFEKMKQYVIKKSVYMQRKPDLYNPTHLYIFI